MDLIVAVSPDGELTFYGDPAVSVCVFDQRVVRGGCTHSEHTQSLDKVPSQLRGLAHLMRKACNERKLTDGCDAANPRMTVEIDDSEPSQLAIDVRNPKKELLAVAQITYFDGQLIGALVDSNGRVVCRTRLLQTRTQETAGAGTDSVRVVDGQQQCEEPGGVRRPGDRSAAPGGAGLPAGGSSGAARGGNY